MNIVDCIYRYPIKGFPGEALPEVDLRQHEGIVGDRTIAVGSGSIPVNDEGEWTPCQAFQRMTIRPDLCLFKVTRDAESIHLKSPSDQTHLIESHIQQIVSLSDCPEEQNMLYRSSNNRGYWDHEDAAISIINVATVEEIAKACGQSIDPLRFRANLYIRAEPWSEFAWLGRQLTMGEATLDIIRPIDRCSTTSVNLETGKLDLNMPALLKRYFGHIFCGVYASVNHGGNISIGDQFKCRDKVDEQKMKRAIMQKTAPPLFDWPRPARIVDINVETEEINSFWIEDSLYSVGALSDYKAGQYIRVHSLSNSHTWRSYTISGIKDKKLRITVKRDSGVGSQAIHEFNKYDEMMITGPFGEASLQTSQNYDKAIHFISAGIGITPMVAKLQDLVSRKHAYPICISHVARSRSELALWGDVLEASQQLADITVDLYLTSKGEGIIDKKGVTIGRPNPQTLAKQVEERNPEVHLCGPTSFVEDMLEALKVVSIDDDRIIVDRFNSPNVNADMREIPQSAPIEVTFAKSKMTDYWNPSDGTLLEFTESRGVAIESHCRAGLCQTCRCIILNGSTTRLLGKEGVDKKETLLCSSVPKESLVLDL